MAFSNYSVNQKGYVHLCLFSARKSLLVSSKNMSRNFPLPLKLQGFSIENEIFKQKEYCSSMSKYFRQL